MAATAATAPATKRSDMATSLASVEKWKSQLRVRQPFGSAFSEPSHFSSSAAVRGTSDAICRLPAISRISEWNRTARSSSAVRARGEIRGSDVFFASTQRFARDYSAARIDEVRHRIRTMPERARMTRPMRRLGRLVFVTAAFAALLALPGCATMNVSSHIERGVDFAQFRTWDFGPADALPTGDPRLDNNPFFKDYLEGAVGKALEVRHYARVMSGAPDLLV